MADHKKNKKSTKNSGNMQTCKGVLELTRGGLGYVKVEGREKDILVKRENLGTALNGDEVRVEMRGYFDGRRTEGKIVEVIKRKQTDFTGKIEVHVHFAFLVPDSDRMPTDIFVPLHLLNNAKDGDKAVVRIIEWTEKSKNPVGEVIRILTYESGNEIAMQQLLTENGFPLHFPDDVMEDAGRMQDMAEMSEKTKLKGRRDLRDTLTFTIDPVDARDFDDALSFVTLKGGWYEVGVHIADVAHYIEVDSALDREAYKRATSVYLPDRVLPMLPERLSNELCSLRPEEEKFTFSTIFKINKKGHVADTWIGKTLIRSNHRFTYEEVQETLEAGTGIYKDELVILNTMAQALRKARFDKGAINFSSQEVQFKLDESAKPVGIMVKESKEAHQLIEEFMLLANRTVADYVSKQQAQGKPVPFPYRIHDAPNEEKLAQFSAFAGRYGVRFDLSGPEAIAKSFNEMLATVQGKPEQHVLEQLGIRTMAKAIYSTDNIGHYGLGFEKYCHFTSPIRRYPDVLVHRVLQQCLETKIEPAKHMEAQCRHCSEQERKAMDTERAANKYKQVEYMMEWLGEDFDCVVSGVASFGFFVETVEQKCEGLVTIAGLYELDQFVYVEEDYALVGRRSGLRFAMGDKVRVKLVAANLEKRQLDFDLVQLVASRSTPKKQKTDTYTKKTKKKK